MRVSEVEGAAAFLEVAGPFLQRDEAVHCILLGIPGDFVRYGGGEGARFWVVEDGGGVLGAAMVTPPMSVSVSLMERDTVRALASAVSAGDAEVRGVVGPAGVADAFDREWRTITGGSSEVVGAGQHAWELVSV